MITLDAKVRGEALTAAARGLGELVQLRASAAGVELTDDARAELLAKAVAREAVKVVGEFLAFEQAPGKPNRKFVRFRDGALAAIGRTGRGKPFLRDHDQWDVRARGGTILESDTVKVGDGHYEIRQTIEITEPEAVERALRGLMSSVSIGWVPTGPVLCSACGTEVLRGGCYHWPGDKLKLEGGTEVVRIEWIYTAAELVETSEVSVPAVPGAALERIKASLAADDNGDRAAGAALERPQPPQENRMKDIKLALIGLLGLAATASDDEVIDAATTLRRERDTLSASNTELAKLQTRLAAENEASKAAARQRDIEAFIAEQVQAGKCSPGSALETSLRDFFAVDQDGARKLAGSLPRLTPVGEPPQRGAAPPPAPPAPDQLGGSVEQAFQAHGISPAGASKVLAALGHTNPTASIAKFAPRVFGVKEA